MRRIYILFLVSVVFFGSLPFSAAQTAARGGLQDQVFVIQKDREIRLPKQIRSFEKMPALPQPKALGSLTFPVIPFFLSVPASEIQAEPAKKEWEVPKLDLYPGLVRVGYGNFLSPLVEGRYLSTQSSEWQYATKFYHQSFGKGPVRWMDEESKESHTELAGDVSYFLDESELYSSLDLKRDAYTFYGRDLGFVIPTNVDFGSYFASNKQLHGDLKLGIRDLDKVGRIGYAGEIVLGGFRDSYAVREQELGFEGEGEFRPSKEVKASLGVSYFTTATEDLKYDLNRNYFSIRPEGQYRFGDFHFTAAVVLVAFQSFNIQPGPMLFQTNPEIVWGLIASLFVGNFLLLVLNLPLIRFWVMLLKIPAHYLYAGITTFALLGAYALNNSTFDLQVALAVGVIGFLFRRFGVPITPLIIGAILGPLSELYFKRSLQISQGDWAILIDGTFPKVIYGILILVIIGPLVWNFKKTFALKK